MEEIDPIGRIVRACGGGAVAGGKLCLELEGVLFTASETEARGREGRAAVAGTVALLAALDFRDVTEPTGETTDGREAEFTSVGRCLDEAEDANDASKVEVRDLGGGGAPVAEGALGGSIDDLLLGGAGPELDPLDEAMVEVFVGFAEDVLVVGFLAVAVLERGEEGDAIAVLPGGAALALPAPNVAEFEACPTHG